MTTNSRPALSDQDDIIADRPRGDLRKWAMAARRAAGRRQRPNDQRARPADVA